MKYRDIRSVMKYGSGLFLYDPATGRGKSHVARQLLYQNSKQGLGKQIFITNNIKNLSVKEWQELFQDDGRGEMFNQDVLHIKANVDFVIDSLPEIIDYPEDYQTELYKKIRSKIEEYRNEEGQRKIELKEYLRNELEPEFRTELKKLIRTALPKKSEERQQVMNEDKKWEWLTQLYPTVKVWNYKIFIMTVKKFIQVVDPLIDKNFIFLNSDFTEDATVVIDEFDETKQVLLEDIIDSALKSKIDLLSTFQRIYSALTEERYTKILRKYDKRLERGFLENRGEKFPSLIEEAEQLYSKFRLDLFYKTVGTISQSSKVVFFDGAYHFSYDTNDNLTSGIVNAEENRVELSFISKLEYKKTIENGAQMKPLDMISEVYRFIEKFQYAVEQWAYQLRTETNDHREMNDNRMTRQQSIESMFNLIDFTDEVIKSLINRKVDRRIRKRVLDETAITMQWYEYVDSDSNYFKTIIQLLRIDDLPETAIISLAKRSRVVGLSATALTPTVLGNYDLRRIQSQLGSNYHIAFEEKQLFSEATKKEYQGLNKMYQEKGIGFTIASFEKFFDLTFSEGKIKKIIAHYAKSNNQELLKTISKKISDGLDKVMKNIEKDDVSYYCNRYVELLESFCIFITSEHHSILALTKALPKLNKWEFEEKFICTTFNELTNYYGIEADIFILRGEEFDSNKKRLLRRLAKGEKIYILTSYATTGAGQNLQYEINESTDTVNITSALSEKNFNVMMKDIDGVYLGNITYLLSYLNFNVEEEVLNKQIINFLVEIEYLFANGEIEKHKKDEIIHNLLKIYVTKQPQSLGDIKLDDTLSARLKATKLVIQAVGRITRTQNKNKNIMMLVSLKLLEKITDAGLNFNTLTPEMIALLEYKQQKKITDHGGKETEVLRNRRNNLALNASKKYLDRLLSSIGKSEKAREDWRSLRIQLLRHPTVDQLPEGELADAYIEVPGGQGSQYFYAIATTTNDYYFGTTKAEVQAQIAVEADTKTIYEISEERARLPQLLLYPGMKDYFSEMEFATKFAEKRYMVNPMYYQQILKGAYGEYAGKYIIETELGSQLKEIRTDRAFELFDFRDDQGNYYDFKNWQETSRLPVEEARAKNHNKLTIVGGKRAWIINLIKPRRGDLSFGISQDRKIVEVPWLIDSKGNSKLGEWAREIWREMNE